MEIAFSSATGYSMADLALLLSGVVAVFIFLWAAWVSMALYLQWARGVGDVTFMDVMWGAIRSIVILTFVIYLINY